VLAQVLGAGTPPAPEEVRRRVGEVFDARLAYDAAPLALPSQRALAERVRTQLLFAAERLVEALHAGGYRIVAMEAPVKGPLLGRPMSGSIDCLVEAEGEEAILDFKYAGRKHQAKLAEGRGVQLAVYAAAREAETGKAVGGIGYLVLADARLYTPEGSPLRGARWLEPGPSLKQTWDTFAAALEAADGWRSTGAVPARPLQSPEAWGGASLVIETTPEGVGEPCRYCHFGALCGKEARP